jgi:hypothetical protein
MALARIITRLSSGYSAVEQDLRARGFQVETRHPDEVVIEPADLEITIEECGPERALTRALDGGVDATVFVAPGALTGQPLVAIPSLDPAVSSNPASAQQPEHGLGLVIEHAPMAESAADLQSTLAPAEMIGAQSMPAQSIPKTDTPIGDLAWNIEAGKDVLAMENQESLQPESILPQTQPEEISLVTGNQEASVQHMESGPVPDIQPDLDTAIEPQSEVPENAVVLASEFSPPHTPELFIPEQQALEAEPVGQAADFELTRDGDRQTDGAAFDQDLDAEPVQEPVFAASDMRTPELEAVVPVMSEIVDSVDVPISLHSEAVATDTVSTGPTEHTAPSDWPIWQPLADPTPVRVVESAVSDDKVPAAVVQQAESSDTAPSPLRSESQIPQRLRLQAYRAALKRFSIDDTLFWKTATLAATVAVAAMLVAVSFHRFSPIPAALDDPAQQSSGEVQQPSTVVNNHPEKSSHAVVKTVAAESLVESKPPALVEGARSRTPDARAAQKVNLAASKQQIVSKPQPSLRENDVIAEDTVVRFGASPVSLPSAPTHKKPQVKRYSDMN